MKLANEKLSSNTIFAHVCYNSGRMMIKNKTNNGLFKYDPEDLGIEDLGINGFCIATCGCGKLEFIQTVYRFSVFAYFAEPLTR